MSLQPVDLSGYLSQVSRPERELMRLFRARRPSVIFDIGACEGEDSVRYARRFPTARVFAFEPLPANQELIRQNMERHAIHNVELIPQALSDHEGPARFHVSSGTPEVRYAGDNWNYGNKSSSLLEPEPEGAMPPWLEFRETVTVSCTTLDRFCARQGIDRVDFIHMDVQGAEFLVLQGGMNMLGATRALWLEVMTSAVYRGQHLKHEVQALLAGMDFALLHEDERGPEGDCFYLNRRWGPARWRLRQHQLARAAASLWRRGTQLAYLGLGRSDENED